MEFTVENKKIYTHAEAANIIDLFENVLIENNISIPSPEDDEREKDDMLGLYGSTYSNLLDEVESRIEYIANRSRDGAQIVTGMFP